MEASEILQSTRTVLVVDWPSREVPDTLARAGFTTIGQVGPAPDDYVAYILDGDEVVERAAQAPERVDLVYSYRPVEEMAEIAGFAAGLGAQAVWHQTGSAEAREPVEEAGLVYLDQPYIVDAVRELRPD